MAKVRNLSELQQSLAFTEFDFYQHFEESFERSELGRIKSLLPLRGMAVKFGLIEERPSSLRVKRGRKSCFTPEGKVALLFLKMYTGLSAPKLMEALNGNIHYQIFCGIRINPENPLSNYKLIDDIVLELSRSLRIQEQQVVLANIWKPYMKNLDTVYTDATCYESWMHFPTDAKLLWECIEKIYAMMCGISAELGEHRLRTKYNDVAKARLAYAKQRKHSKQQNRKIIRRMLVLLGKMLGEVRRQLRLHPEMSLLTDSQKEMLAVVTKVYRQQSNHFKSGDQGYSGNENRSFCHENGIETSFVPKGRAGKNETKSAVRRELSRVRTTAMEGSFGTQKNHYGLSRMVARLKSTETLMIFFGIHTANAVLLARRKADALSKAA